SVVLLILQHFAGLGVEFDVPLHTFAVAQFKLIDVATVLFFQFGVLDGGAGVLGQGRFVELLEGLDGTGVAQAKGLVRADVLGQGQVGGDSEGGGSEQRKV